MSYGKFTCVTLQDQMYIMLRFDLGVLLGFDASRYRSVKIAWELFLIIFLPNSM